MTTATQAAPTAPSTWSRIYGLGSIFAKTVRDSRRTTIIAGVLLALALPRRQPGDHRRVRHAAIA